MSNLLVIDLINDIETSKNAILNAHFKLKMGTFSGNIGKMRVKYDLFIELEQTKQWEKMDEIIEFFADYCENFESLKTYFLALSDDEYDEIGKMNGGKNKEKCEKLKTIKK